MSRVIPISHEDAIKILNGVSEMSPSTVRDVFNCFERTESNRNVSSPVSAHVIVHEQTGKIERVISFEQNDKK